MGRRRCRAVCGKGFGLGSLVRRVGWRLRDSLPTGLLVPRRLGDRAPAGPAGDAERLGPLPALDEQARDLALDAPPQRHGHCPDHGQHQHRPRFRQLRLRGLLSGPRAVCRGLHVPLAQSGLDDVDRRRLCPRMLDGGRRPGSQCGRREGTAWQVGGDVCPGLVRQSHHRVRTHEKADGGGQGAEGATGAHRVLPGDPRHDRADRLHGLPWDPSGQGAGWQVRRGAGGRSGRGLGAVTVSHVGGESPHR